MLVAEQNLEHVVAGIGDLERGEALRIAKGATNVGLAKQIDDVCDAAARKCISLNPVSERLEHDFDRGRCALRIDAKSCCEVLDDCRASGVVENAVDLQVYLQWLKL